MIGEYVLDCCIKTCISEASDPLYSSLLNSVHFILTWYKKETPKDAIPIEFKDKLDLAMYVCNYRITNKEYNFDKMMEHGVLNDYSVNMDNLVNATKEFNAADIVKGLCYKLSKYCTKNKIKKLDDETLCNYLKERERDIYDRFYAVDHGKKVLEKIPTGYA